MKFGSFTPKPGDLFQWYYDFDDEKLPDSYNIWLGDQRIFVSSSGINMLVSLTITDIWWINNCHFIHARVDEMSAELATRHLFALHPRARG